MIVAVEGPSAAGKTTWCRSAAAAFVAEYTPDGNEPDVTNAEQRAHFWTDVNSRRWSSALELEVSTGMAVCDGDPLKLHYSWCMARIAAAPPERFCTELAQARLAIQQRRLGLADAVVVLTPDNDVVRTRKASDASRSRRSFEVHVRLREPLIEWCQRLDELSPGRVLWNAADVDALRGLQPRPDRYDVTAFDEFIGQLPALPSRGFRYGLA